MATCLLWLLPDQHCGGSVLSASPPGWGELGEHGATLLWKLKQGIFKVWFCCCQSYQRGEGKFFFCIVDSSFYSLMLYFLLSHLFFFSFSFLLFFQWVCSLKDSSTNTYFNCDYSVCCLTMTRLSYMSKVSFLPMNDCFQSGFRVLSEWCLWFVILIIIRHRQEFTLCASLRHKTDQTPKGLKLWGQKVSQFPFQRRTCCHDSSCISCLPIILGTPGKSLWLLYRPWSYWACWTYWELHLRELLVWERLQVNSRMELMDRLAAEVRRRWCSACLML